MRHSIVPCAADACGCQLDRLRSDFSLRHATLLRDPLGRMTIAVAGRKLHRGIDPRGIPAQYVFDDTDTFNEVSPVDGAQKAKTPDAVTDRNLIGRLLLVRHLHQLLD